jgi:hypothetical protein
MDTNQLRPSFFNQTPPASNPAPQTVQQAPPPQVSTASNPVSETPNQQMNNAFFGDTGTYQYNNALAPKLSDVRQLVNLGHIQKEFEFYGLQVKIHTLSAKETSDALKSLAIMSETSRMYDLAIAVLARAVDEIGGVSLEHLYESMVPSSQQQGGLDKISKRLAVVGSLSQQVLMLLLGEYQRVMDEATQQIGAELVLKK